MTALSGSLSGCYTNERGTLLRGWALELMPIAWKERHETDVGSLQGSFCVPGKTSPKDLSSVYLSCKIKCNSQEAEGNSHLYHDPTT